MSIEVNEISEIFAPALDEENAKKFRCLVKRIGEVFPNYKALLIKKEIESAGINIDENDLEGLKYIVALRVLYDLTQQGWELEIKDNEVLYLAMTTENSNDKGYVRHRLSGERKAQFKVDSTLRFIERMERIKTYRGRRISIKNLIGDKDALIQAVRGGGRVVDPYIQLITHSTDEHTGYRDTDIWRYFRYTWSIPYKSMPGRNLFYLVRDRAQELHPVIGIFALGNSALNLSVRDNEIGWTVDAIRSTIERRSSMEVSTQEISHTNGKTVTTRRTRYLETEEEHMVRVDSYSQQTMNVLLRNLRNALNDIYVSDLGYQRGTENPSEEQVDELKRLYEELRNRAIDNKKTVKVTDWESETKEILFKKKRAYELGKLLDAARWFDYFKCDSYTKWLAAMIKNEQGRKAVNVALIANRKTRIGSNMMEIIVCGAIPPYNELLGGKLVSILACSPTVIRDYTEKYTNQVSEIASRMKGERVVRDSRLAFLGTTSLYSVGSSQYNRIKIPINDTFTLVSPAQAKRPEAA